MRIFPIVLLGLLCAPLPASADGAPKGAAEPANRDCAGFECFEKRVLWETAMRWRSKHDTAQLDLDLEKIQHRATKAKLASRTSSVVRALSVPPAPPTEVGHSTVILVIAAVVAFVAGAAVAGLVSRDPSTVVVK